MTTTTENEVFDIYAVLDVFDYYSEDDAELGKLYDVFNERLKIWQQDDFLALIVKTANEYYSYLEDDHDNVAAALAYKYGFDAIVDWVIDTADYRLTDSEETGLEQLLDYAIDLRNNY